MKRKAAEDQEKDIESTLSGRGDLSKIFDQMGGDAKFDPFSPKDNKFALEGMAGTQQAIKLQAELNDIRLKGSESLEDEQIKMQEANGTLSKHAAALALAALHTRQYNEALAELQAQPFSDEQQKKLATLQANRDTQNLQDRVAGNQGSFSQVMQQFVQNLDNVNSKLATLAQSTLNSFNDALFMSKPWERKAALKSTAASAVRGLAKTGLEKAEGGILGALGSSPMHAMWVKMAGLPGVGGSGTSGGSGKGSGLGGILGSLLHMIPGFASGGDPEVGQASIVGENGPELFVPKRSGTVIPNGKSMGGSSDAYYTIDARGASAAEVDQRVRAALVQVHGSAVRNSLQASQEMRNRKPASSR